MADVKIGDLTLLAITYDNLKLLDRLLEFEEAKGNAKSRGRGSGWNRTPEVPEDDNDSEEFPRFMTPLLLATQCGLYETVEYLVNRGHKLDRPHPPRCTCDEGCAAAAKRGEVVTDSCERLNSYWAISNPTFMCTTSSSSDPVLECFRLHDELLLCGAAEQVYKTMYMSMAQQVIYVTLNIFVPNEFHTPCKLFLIVDYF